MSEAPKKPSGLSALLAASPQKPAEKEAPSAPMMEMRKDPSEIMLDANMLNILCEIDKVADSAHSAFLKLLNDRPHIAHGFQRNLIKALELKVKAIATYAEISRKPDNGRGGLHRVGEEAADLVANVANSLGNVDMSMIADALARRVYNAKPIDVPARPVQKVPNDD